MHKHDKIVAIWIDVEAPYVENESFYEQVYDLQIDMLTTDYPERAHKCLQKIHLQRKQQKIVHEHTQNEEL